MAGVITRVRQGAVLAGVLILCVLAPFRAAGDDAKLQQARALIRAGKPAQAVPIYEELLGASPQNPSLVMNLAIALFQAGEFERAAEQCRTALSLRPGWGSALLFLGASHLRLGEAAQAIEFLEKAAEAQPDERNTRLMLGEALLQTGRAADSISHLEKASELLPNNPRVWYSLARAYSSLARERLGEIESSGRESAYWHALAGDDFVRREQLGRALEHYRKALEMQPKMGSLHASVASLYEQAGRKDWAALESEKAPPLTAGGCDSSDADCLYRAREFQDVLGAAGSLDPLARAYWEVKAYRGLADLASEKLEQLPPSAQLHELAARSLADRGLDAEAAKRWREALALDPDNAVLKEGLAVSLRNSVDHEAAIALFAELIAKQPDRADLSYLYGDSLVELGRPQEAVPLLEAAVKRDPKLLAARASLGRAYVLLGEPQKGVPHIRAALPADEDGSIHYQLAMAYRATGERELSRETLARYEEVRSQAAARRKELEGEVPLTAP